MTVLGPYNCSLVVRLKEFVCVCAEHFLLNHFAAQDEVIDKKKSNGVKVQICSQALGF